MLLSGGQASLIIHFLCMEGARPADIHSQVKHVYGDDCSIHQCLTVARASKKVGAALRTWHASVIHPTLFMVPGTHANVSQMVQCNCCVLLQHNTAHLGISMECVHHIVTPSSGVLECLRIIGAKEFK
jgi:hypothetical protein